MELLIMSKCLPNQGGCWFCHTDNKYPREVFDGWYFCHEFDTYIHQKCLITASKIAKPDQETAIILREFKSVLMEIARN